LLLASGFFDDFGPGLETVLDLGPGFLAAGFAAAFAVAFLVEAFFPPLALGAEVVSFLAGLPPPRVSTLVLPSLNCHSPQELARTP